MDIVRRVVLVVVGLVLTAPGGSGAFDLSGLHSTPIKFSYYKVQGNDWASIRESIAAMGPKDDAKVARFAYTGWNAKWDWPIHDDGKIDPSTVSVKTEVAILLPQLETSSGNSDLMREWNLVMGKMLAHELNHVRNFEKHRESIQRAIVTAHNIDGDLTARTANLAAQNVLRKIRALDRKYDEDTVHGKLEGVEFPL